ALHLEQAQLARGAAGVAGSADGQQQAVGAEGGLVAAPGGQGQGADLAVLFQVPDADPGGPLLPLDRGGGGEPAVVAQRHADADPDVPEVRPGLAAAGPDAWGPAAPHEVEDLVGVGGA